MDLHPNTNIINIGFGATATYRNLSSHCKGLTITSDQDCYIKFNATTVTAATGYFVPADVPTTFDVLYTNQVAVIRSSADGTLSVMEYGDVNLVMDLYADTATGDASLLKVIAASITGDSNLKATDISATFTSDANLLDADIATTFTGDANLQLAIALTFTGDAVIMTLTEATITGDANLQSEVVATFTGDTNMVSTISGTFTGDGVILT